MTGVQKERIKLEFYLSSISTPSIYNFSSFWLVIGRNLLLLTYIIDSMTISVRRLKIVTHEV